MELSMFTNYLGLVSIFTSGSVGKYTGFSYLYSSKELLGVNWKNLDSGPDDSYFLGGVLIFYKSVPDLQLDY
jgi:hypothetical protein